MKFDNLTNAECLNPTANDPLDCPTKPEPPPPEGEETDYELILKPEYSIRQVGEPVQYRTFLINKQTGEETEILQGLEYRSDNISVALIGPTSGRAFGVNEGITQITVEWQDMLASAQLEITDSCDTTKVGMMLVVDNSKSMGQQFTIPPVPDGQPAYATKLNMVKALCKRFVSEVDESKDLVGLIKFSDGATISSELTSDMDAVDSQVNLLNQTQNSTNMGAALTLAIQRLMQAKEDGTINTMVVILFSDGNNNDGPDVSPIAQEFLSSNGILAVLGARAAGDGFALLKEICTEGMFINARGDNVFESGNWLSGIKGYFCAGHCEPEGNVTANMPALNYTDFEQWDVVQGEVDLIGGTYPYEAFNFLPGNGLYVDLSGSGPDFEGIIQSKAEFDLIVGKNYKLSFRLAGNQRLDKEGYKTVVKVTNPELSVNETITIDDYAQGFTLYEFSFTAPSSGKARITFEGINPDLEGFPVQVLSFGNLLDSVVFEDTDTSEVILEDDFDEENPKFIPPSCVSSSPSLLSEGYGYCPARGCLNEPIPQQSPDPTPLPEIEL